MTVKKVQFERKNLRYRNFVNNYHMYKSMSTSADGNNSEIPESVIKVLYRIYSENKENTEE